MAICVGCGLEVDNNNVLKVHLASASGILCSDTDGLSVNTGCGLQITPANEVAIRGASDSTIAYANSDANGTVDADFVPAIGVGAGTCGGNNRSGLICDATNGLWTPGKLGTALSAQSVGLLGSSLDQIFAPIKFPDRYPTNITSPNWQVLGQGGAEALCWELANDTCYDARGLITANVNIPMFYIRPNEWFIFQLAERLNYKTSRDGLPLAAPTNTFLAQSTISLDYRWLTAAMLDPGVPGVAVAGVMFDFSNLVLPPGSVARGESVILMRRMAGAGAINNTLVDPILGTGPAFTGTSGYLHEYRVQVASGHHILAGETQGTIANGVVVQGNPCFFDT